MLLGFLLLFFFSGSEVQSITETTTAYYTPTETHRTTAQVQTINQTTTLYDTTTETHTNIVQAGEKLGISALVLSLLALIITLTVLSWLCWQRFGDTATTSNTDSKGFPGTERAPNRGGFPQPGADGDVYINYSSTNQAYTDLNPTNMTADNVYSSLS